MKLHVSKEHLSLATNRAQGAIHDRSLAQIALKAENNTLEIAATDRVLAIYSRVICEVVQPGTVFVPAKIFSDLVKELPDGSVELSRQDAFVIVKAGSGPQQFTMKIPVIEDLVWKDAPAFTSDNSAELATNDLSYMIEQVQFCVTHDSPRNYGTVAYLHKPKADLCRLVGTDGFRLSMSESHTGMSDSFLSNGVCLSKRALAEIHRMCGEGFEKVRIAISDDETTLLAEVPDYQLFIRLSLVKYPNYLGVIPSKDMAAVLVSRPHLQIVTKRVLLAADKSRALQLSFSNSSLTLNSRTMGSSESREVISLDDYQGPKFDIAINGKYLTDVFSTMASDNLTVQFNQESKDDPIVIVPRTEPPNCRSKHVLVPIKQSE